MLDNQSVSSSENLPSTTREHEVVWQAIQVGVKKAPNKKFGLLVITLLSVVVFGSLHAASDGIRSALVIIAVLTVHELGHVLAMKAVGYKDVSILFIPFFGALTKGEVGEFDPSKQATVALAGPVFGFLVAIIAMLVFKITNVSILVNFALTSLYLNIFNLLPFWPLDGGRFFKETLLSQSPILQLLFSLLGATGLVWAGVKLMSPFLIYFSVFTVPSSLKAFSWNRLVAKVQKKLGQSGQGELALPQVGFIYDEIQKDFPNLIAKQNDPRKTAKLVTDVWKLSGQKKISVSDAAIILAIGLVVMAVVIGILGYLVNPYVQHQ